MTNYPKEEIERVRQAHPLENYLPTRGHNLRKCGKELVCLCPFHTEKSPSFSVNTAKQVWTCRAGCGGGDVFAFVQKLDDVGFAEAVEKLGGRAEADDASTSKRPVAPVVSAPPQKARIVAEYTYTDATGKELFQAVRLEPKSFRQRRWQPDGSWVWNLDSLEPVLYRLPDVVASDYVWILEGEKDADNVAQFGLTATTNAMGALKWRESYTAALRGKRVILCGDNDEPGKKHMDAVEKAVAPVALSTRRVHVPAPFKDLSEYLAAATTPEAGMKSLLDIAAAAPELYNGVELPIQSMGELEQEYRTFIKVADKRAVNFGEWMPRLGALRPVVPGELVVFLANTGMGKTATLQNIAASFPHLPILFFEMELPGTLTFERFAALASGESARRVWGAYKQDGTVKWRESGKLNHIHVCSKSGIKVAAIERVVTLSHLKTGQGTAVVLVDYVGLLHGEGKSRYERTSSVAEELKVLAKRTNTVVICASQVSRDKDDPHAEVSIFSGKDSGSIENSSGLLFGLWRDKEQAGRAYLRVLKSTKGGSGLTVACDFDGETMRITESKDQSMP